MLPEASDFLEELEEESASGLDDSLPSFTYRIDFENKRIMGSVDDLDSVVQAVVKVMNTERFAYEIYDDDYGSEFESLIGQEREFVMAVIEQRVEEAVTSDDRVSGISEFELTVIRNDSIGLKFTVQTIYGDFVYEGVIE